MSTAGTGAARSSASGLAGQAEVTHVLFDNCYSDYAHRNAQQLEILVS